MAKFIKSKIKKVIIIHPYLSFGGSERLLLSIAKGLINRKHSVTIYCNNYDPKHCFDDCKIPGLIIKEKFKSIPNNLIGRFKVIFSTIKLFCIGIYTSFDEFDVAIADLHPAPVVAIKLMDFFRCKNRKVVYYCHYPDKELAERTNPIYKFYRIFVDWYEEKAYHFCDKVFVNSEFTKKVFKKSLPSISSNPEVLYPPVPKGATIKQSAFKEKIEELSRCTKIILSINRITRKKKLELAIESLKILKDDNYQNLKLLIAGGYNVDDEGYLQDLKKGITKKEMEWSIFPSVKGDVIFILSFTDEEKAILMKYASCLLYTPPNEHFGIVPLEAMRDGVPVIAANSGGPLESIVHMETGILVEPKGMDFAEAIKKILNSKDFAKKLIFNGKNRVERMFTEKIFVDQFEKKIRNCDNKTNSSFYKIISILLVFLGIIAIMTRFL